MLHYNRPPHSRTVHAGADAVVKHKWHTIVHQFLEVVVPSGVLGLRHDYAAHLIFKEVVAYSHFLVIAFVALSHHNTVATCTCFFLYT